MQQTDKFRWIGNVFSGTWLNEQNQPIVVLTRPFRTDNLRSLADTVNFRALADGKPVIVIIDQHVPRFFNALTLEQEYNVQWLTLDLDSYARLAAEGIPCPTLTTPQEAYEANLVSRIEDGHFGYHPQTRPQPHGWGHPPGVGMWDRNRPRDPIDPEAHLPPWARTKSASRSFGRDYGREQLNVVPTCQCGNKRGPAFIGMTCANCQTKVLAVEDVVITLPGIKCAALPVWAGREGGTSKLKLVGVSPGKSADALAAYAMAVATHVGWDNAPAPVPVSFEQLRGWYTDERWEKVTKELTPFVVVRLREVFPQLVNSQALELTDAMFQDMASVDSRSEGLLEQMAEVGLDTATAIDFGKVSETQLAMGRVLIAGHIQTPWERGETIQWDLP
ncbi:hypothetical protein [Xanthomonas phage RTH11]|nr:hypothetical protein [Xanthomonas phage RTH11]